SAGRPFATLERARDAVRGLKGVHAFPADGVTVWIHDGVYALAGGFSLTADDSGQPGAPVVYRAAEGASPRIIGGRALPPNAFAPVCDEAVLKRLDLAAHGNVRYTDLRALGIEDTGVMPDHFEAAPALSELYFDGARMTLAQWPNDGWAEIAEVIESGPAPWRNHASDHLGVFAYGGDRPARWAGAPAVWLQGYWCFDWAIDSIRVKTIDTGKRHITLAQPHVYGIGSGNKAQRRYKAFNLLEELDQPGEYFIDRDNGTLYFWPPAPPADHSMVLTTLRVPLIAMRDCSNIALRGLTFEMCAGTAIQVDAGTTVTIGGCTVRNTGLGAIAVNGGEGHAVAGCDIYNTGTHGIEMSGGDRKTLAPSRHEVRNCDIYNVSLRQRTHAYNLLIGGVGVRVAHNRIHDAPHQGITLGGNDHVIEYNEVFRIGMDSDDCGAFYMGRNPSERGTVLRYNFWHDVGSTMAHGSSAVYFDDGAGGQRVYGNVFLRAAGGDHGAVFSHGGHDNWVENNVFIECKRAMGAAPWPDAGWQQWLGEPLWQERLLKDVDITRPPYIDRYPELAGYMESWKTPRLNHSARNVIVRCGSSIDGNWDVRDNLILRWDPGFIDAANNDYALRDDSIVFKTIAGFEPIPFARIGLEQDEYRPAKQN
ncbi:MAG: right-handed parallel beta-helix repeat-containing protein, partial [Candidatus Hydrogenedentes bacterium]|nr:right-handed parallel beta-helix repeat-containing protein [Candidatus Hydrogenedentota bacterium]